MVVVGGGGNITSLLYFGRDLGTRTGWLMLRRDGGYLRLWVSIGPCKGLRFRPTGSEACFKAKRITSPRVVGFLPSSGAILSIGSFCSWSSLLVLSMSRAMREGLGVATCAIGSGDCVRWVALVTKLSMSSANKLAAPEVEDMGPIVV